MIKATRRALYLAFVSATARAPAFLVPVVVATLFGAAETTDAYFIAYSAVLLIGGTIAQGVEQAIVPFAARQMDLQDGTIRRYLDHAAFRTAGAASAVWLFGVPVFAFAAPSGLRSEVLGYAASLTPLAVTWCAAAVFSGALVSQSRIASATGSMLWRGVGALLGIALVSLGAGLWSVAVGLGLGEICRFWWLRARLLEHVPAGSRKGSPALRPLGQAAVAQVGASAAIGVAPVVERLLAATLGVGAASHLEYAIRLLIIPGVLFEGALAPLHLVRWTKQISRSGEIPSRREVLYSVSGGLALATASAALLIVFAPLFVHLLLGHGRFAPSDEAAVVSLLRVLAVAFIATMGALLIERLYLASMRNRTLAGLSIARATLRLVTVIALMKSGGLLAFAIGYAVADWAYLVALVTLLRPSSAVLRGRVDSQVTVR